jgi:sugar phosphate permease
VTERYDWRAAWAAMAALFVVVAPMAWFWLGQRPEDYGLLPDGGDASQAPATAADGARDRAEEPDWTVGEALHSRSFWLIALGFMLTSFPGGSIFIHMTSFVESKGFTFSEGALAVSFYGLGVLIGRFTWGYVVAHAGVYRALIAYGFGYGASILLFVAPYNLPAIYATTVLLGIAIAGAQQLHVLVFPEYFGRRIVGSLLGYAGAMTAVTGAAAPLVAAAAYDTTESYVATFSVFGFFCFIAGVAFLFSRPTTVRPLASPAAERG